MKRLEASSAVPPTDGRVWWAVRGPDSGPGRAGRESLLSSEVMGAPALNSSTYFRNFLKLK